MEFRTKSHGVGLKSHGLVWNLTVWFEISRGSFEISRVSFEISQGSFEISRVRLKSHGVLLNNMGSSEISQVFIFNQKNWELPGCKQPSTSLTQFGCQIFLLVLNAQVQFGCQAPSWALPTFVEIFLCWVQIPLTQTEAQGQKGNLTYKLNKGLQPWRLLYFHSLQIWKLLV